jgi:Tfp pilus assembly protein PilW
MGRPVKFAASRAFAKSKNTLGLTLLELTVAVGVGSLVLAMAGTFWMFGLRSFASMTNYVDLEGRSRHALDLMTLEMRQASQVIGFQNTAAKKWISLTNADEGVTITYTWDQAARTLVFNKTGQPPQIFLSECDTWDFQVYQRTPQQNTASLFYPATNAFGAYDASICKLVDMTWKCSRTILGTKVNTESVHTAQVVLRNKQ